MRGGHVPLNKILMGGTCPSKYGGTRAPQNMGGWQVPPPPPPKYAPDGIHCSILTTFVYEYVNLKMEGNYAGAYSEIRLGGGQNRDIKGWNKQFFALPPQKKIIGMSKYGRDLTIFAFSPLYFCFFHLFYLYLPFFLPSFLSLFYTFGVPQLPLKIWGGHVPNTPPPQYAPGSMKWAVCLFEVLWRRG